jgi:hypothetical protein
MSRQSFDEDMEEMMSPPKKANEAEKSKPKVQGSIGKRFHKAQNKLSATMNNRMMDDPISITPFSQDNLGGGGMDPKPYKTVIKRYWTEEEVRILD